MSELNEQNINVYRLRTYGPTLIIEKLRVYKRFLFLLLDPKLRRVNSVVSTRGNVSGKDLIMITVISSFSKKKYIRNKYYRVIFLYNKILDNRLGTINFL